MESSDEDLLLKLVFPSSPISIESSSEEGSLTLNEMEAKNNDVSNVEELFDGNIHDSFGLVPENMTRHEGILAHKDRKHPSRETVPKLSDKKLEEMSIQDLNKQFRELPEGLVQRYRKRRRILKNRKYALKCRQRSLERRDNIAEQNAALELEIFRAKEKLRKVTNERDDYKQKCARLNAMLSTSQSLAMAPSKSSNSILS